MAQNVVGYLLAMAIGFAALPGCAVQNNAETQFRAKTADGKISFVYFVGYNVQNTTDKAVAGKTFACWYRTSVEESAAKHLLNAEKSTEADFNAVLFKDGNSHEKITQFFSECLLFPNHASTVFGNNKDFSSVCTAAYNRGATAINGQNASSPTSPKGPTQTDANALGLVSEEGITLGLLGGGNIFGVFSGFLDAFKKISPKSAGLATASKVVGALAPLGDLLGGKKENNSSTENTDSGKGEGGAASKNKDLNAAYPEITIAEMDKLVASAKENVGKTAVTLTVDGGKSKIDLPACPDKPR
jgi:hypothetical protein